MKPLMIYAVLGLLLVFGSADIHAQEIPFTLKIESKSPWPNSIVFLSYLKPAGEAPSLDSAILVNGKAVIKGSVSGPQKALVYIEVANKGFFPNYTKASKEIYLEKGIIKFTTSRNVADANLSGTPLNNDLQGYTNVLLKFKPTRDSLSNKFGVAYRDKIREDLNRLSKEFKVLDSATRKAELTHFRKTPNSVVSLEWLAKNVNIALQKQQAQSLFAALSDEVKTSKQGKTYIALLNKTASIAIGSLAPDFNAKTIDGGSVTLGSFKGEYVFLDFWASWCGPCRAENPNVLKAYHTFRDHNLKIISFSVDDSKEAWSNAVKVDGLPWTQVSDLKGWKGEISRSYGVESIPANFLIDPDGKIIARNLRGDELQQELNRVLKKDKQLSIKNQN